MPKKKAKFALDRPPLLIEGATEFPRLTDFLSPLRGFPDEPLLRPGADALVLTYNVCSRARFFTGLPTENGDGHPASSGTAPKDVERTSREPVRIFHRLVLCETKPR